MSKKSEELEKKMDDAWNKYCHYRNELRKLEIKELDFDYKGKFIKYSRWYEDQYLFVSEQFRSNDGNWYLRGVGFDYEFSAYNDNTFFNFDWMEEISIPDKDVKEYIKDISVITKEEFIEKFNIGVEKMKEKYFDIIQNHLKYN